MKKRKRTSKNEFRFNNRTNHPNYIFEDDGRRYSALGITHSAETMGKKNMPLSVNPQVGKYEKSYIRHGVIQLKHEAFGSTNRKFKFSKEDFTNVRSKIRKYKKIRKKHK